MCRPKNGFVHRCGNRRTNEVASDFIRSLATTVAFLFFDTLLNNPPEEKTGSLVWLTTAFGYVDPVFFLITFGMLFFFYRKKCVHRASRVAKPTQQVARTVIYHPDAFSNEQLRELDRLFSDRLEEFGEQYEPKRSDHIKGRFIYAPSMSDLASFFSIWFQGFLHQPGCYAVAAFLQNGGYLYIGEGEFYTFGYSMDNLSKEEPSNRGSILLLDNASDWQVALRTSLKQFTLFVKSFPLTALLYRPAFYTWLLFVLLGWLLRKREFVKCLPFTVPLVILAICCVSPLSGAFRYSMPVVLSSTILLGYIFNKEYRELAVPRVQNEEAKSWM